ncbi:glycosyl transferase family, a/b domain-containing protein [Polychytrium aggregatum]|uniref:glycosyl transferase family, a/b domain-containing protein n=1 Tax=Polychytrium aggregatum TaxID=110093 RepID=UPI0022FE7B3E|nr:glycosyl transferase family, a/b domain-containing protein [Polychytrium aggregatum]KAI9208994.1 glycosyl transferase family, a/b domain-containing protein [Polychytrium aggregatum]
MTSASEKPFSITAALKVLIEQPDKFTSALAAKCARDIMSQKATPAQIAAFLIGLKVSRLDQNPDVIAVVANAMRSAAIPVDLSAIPEPIVDIVGTGGDGQNTFNVSTASGIVAAGAGCRVAKHGSRASSSACGSADVLETLGCDLNNVEADLVPRLLQDESSFCFLFAQKYHPVMKTVAGPRKEIGVRTIFNITGPLANPAKPSHAVIGVYSLDFAPIYAEAVRLSGVKRAWIVNGNGCLDEVSPEGPTHVWSLENDQITKLVIHPSDFGLEEHPLTSVGGGSADENAQTMRDLLSNKLQGPVLDFVLINTASLLYVAGKATDLKDGVRLARESIASGKAAAAFEHFTRSTVAL